MLETLNNMFKVPELRKKMIFTILMILIYRVGAHIPTPGIDPGRLKEFMDASSNNLFGMFDMFVGGSFKKATIFALGIMPYISASIIIQLFGTVFPYFHKLQKEGPEGRKKITQITRYGTLLIAVVQSFTISLFLQSIKTDAGLPVVMDMLAGWQFTALSMITLTTGTIFVMWLGEQMTNRGIGNGISLLILIGIVARLPEAVIVEVNNLIKGDRHIFQEMVIVATIFGMTAFIVWMYQATRRIPIQTARKVVGGKMAAGQNTVLPLRLNMAGVIPIIFASSIMMVPSMVFGLFPESDLANNLGRIMTPGGVAYSIAFAILIILFTYFYTAIIFNPVDIAENLKRSGGFIPSIKPGKETSDYLDGVLNRITLPGSFFLAFISVVPFAMMSGLNVSFFFGGTSVLIVVGVALDSLQQIESHLQSRNYDGLMKKGTLKGRDS